MLAVGRFTVPYVAPEMDPNYDASERAYVRAAARRRWLRANGVETGPIKPRSAYRRLVSQKAKATNRETQRRYRIRQKATRLGITVAEAAAITPATPTGASTRSAVMALVASFNEPGSAG